MKNKITKNGFDYKCKYDTNGNKRYSLYNDGKFISGTNGLNLTNKEDGDIVNALIVYTINNGTKLQKEKLSRCGALNLNQ